MPMCFTCGGFFVKEDWASLAHFKRQCLACKTDETHPILISTLPYKHTLLTFLSLPKERPYFLARVFYPPFGSFLEDLLSDDPFVFALTLALHYDAPIHHIGALALDIVEKIQHAELFSVYIIA